MEKSSLDPNEKGLVLKFPGLDGRLYFHLHEGHFYNLENKCADTQILQLVKSIDMTYDCLAKPGTPHNHEVPSRSDVEISAVLWACKLRAIIRCNTEETVAQIITYVMAAWPHKLPSEAEFQSKFSSSIQKYQRMAKDGNKSTRLFLAMNGEEILSRFREAILRPQLYWDDPIITADPMNPCLLHVNPIRGRNVDEVFEKLDQIIEETKNLCRINSETIFWRSLHQFKSMIKQYRNLLMKISSQRDAERIFEIANRHSILRPAYLDSWLECKQSEIGIVRIIKETPNVRLVNNNYSNFLTRKSQDPILVLHVPSLDTWTKRASEKIERKVKEFALTGTLDSVDQPDLMEDIHGEEYVIWHMNQPQRKQVLNHITQLANHCVRNRDHPSIDHVNCWIIFMVRKTYKECWYSFYIESVLQKTKFNRIPGPPYELEVHAMAAGESREINGPFFRLKWKKRSEPFPIKFLIQYRLKDSDSETWNEKLTNESLKRPYQQDFPQRGSVMEFRIAVETCFGRSDFSMIVDARPLSANEQMEPTEDYEIQKRKNSLDPESEEDCVQFLENVPRPKKQKTVVLPPTQFDVGNWNNSLDSAHDSPAQDFPAHDSPAHDSPAQDSPSQDSRSQDFLVQDFPLQDFPLQDFPTQDSTAQDSTAQDSRAQDSSSEDDCIQLWSNVSQVEKQNTGLFPVIDLQVATVPVNVDELNCTLNSFPFAKYLAKQCEIITKCNGLYFYAVPLTKTTTGNEIETFERFIFKPPGQEQVEENQMKTILLLGGNDPSCKVTFINALVNYVFNVRFEDNFRFQLLEEQATRQTGIRVFEIRRAEGFSIPFSLTIIDIPTCEDTKDLNWDQKIISMIRTFLEVENGHGITELDLIGLVADASQPTLSSVEINFFNSIFSLVGKDLQENIQFLLTNADSIEVPPILTPVMAAGFPCLLDSTTGKPLHHKFNHSNFFGSNRQVLSQERSLRFWYESHGSVCFKTGVTYFHEFFSALGLVRSKSLSMTRQVIEKRKKLESLKSHTQSLYADIVSKEREINQNKRIIADCQTQIDALSEKSFEDVGRKLELNGTLVKSCSKCLVICNNNSCQIEVKFDDPVPKDLNHCHKCPGKCNWDVHSFGQSFKWENAMESVFSETEKKKYDVEMEKKRIALQNIDKLEEDLEEIGKAAMYQISNSCENSKMADGAEYLLFVVLKYRLPGNIVNEHTTQKVPDHEKLGSNHVITNQVHSTAQQKVCEITC